ncbi:HopJ type III effector protein [Mucilaginibacter sp. 5C4]|uniref:HopJ type III effector protein n=2 Tax=Mucilaginibacter TaxID=423349 RepID=UPI002AC8FC6F|nr:MULTISPECIES: HopJ type III effector protein [unclassified Mucilaginibacter]MEB0260976.1 HopJ type III effector protein [Mucilaginibacter sp. 10I4]MEB0279571.1 HopJ type III effector protein [Mucilaginibacter sp. 10B2]MEB0302028.1 HopJ type III effector protein [Mucilaginibacter sp. 5C4]WPX22561.1 HopJ type III effector protein [Mucilaginibacter sp. 5C4]
MKNELSGLITSLKNNTAKFTDVIGFIETYYNHQPTAFKNGEAYNGATQNQGSAKVFTFAQLNNLNEADTLQLFAEHYQAVLNTPDATDHQNIRQFMINGWKGITFEGEALTLNSPMQIEIKHTQQNDSETIFALYDDAIVYQKKVGNNHWLGFEPALIAKEIDENRHFKILADGEIVATFCITLSDPLIWKDSATTPAIYIHRIANSQSFRGHNLLKHIIDWAREFAGANHLLYIRIDTGSGNDRLINYYVNSGFTLIGNTSINYTPDLPAHYKGGIFTLLQMPV